MGEIVENFNVESVAGDNEDDDINKDMVDVIVKTVGPGRPFRLRVPSLINVRELRRSIAGNNHVPADNLCLIFHGSVLHDTKNGSDISIRLKSGDSLMVAVKPKPPAHEIIDNDNDEDDDDDDLKFQLPHSSSLWKKRLYSFLHDKLKLPNIILMGIFSLSVKAWVIIIMWFCLAPVAHSWDLGPLFILGTGFCLILFNLGKRRPGDVSAYSIFNEDFRELPGTLNADRLDRDIRAGQL